MDIVAYRDYCLSKPGVTEDTPFGPDVLVMKVMNKMFALFDIEKFESVNLKCDPERALELRAENPGITPGYHMNKKHWKTIAFDGSVSDELIIELTDLSYDLVRKSLPKKMRDELDELH